MSGFIVVAGGGTNITVQNALKTPVIACFVTGSEIDAATVTAPAGFPRKLVMIGDPVPASGEGRITLPQTISDYNELYLLQPGSFFPYKLVRVYKNASGTGDAVIKVGIADRDVMNAALNLWRSIFASVTSRHSINLNKALLDAQGQLDGNTADVDAAEATIAAYFAATDDTATVTQTAFTTVLGWIHSYAFLWGMAEDGKPGRTYFVYNGDSLQGSPDQIATLALQPPANPPVDPAEHDNGFAITLQREHAGPENLDYKNGGFSDAAALVALGGTFGANTLFRPAKESAQNPMLVGRVDGQSVIALPFKPMPGPGTTSGVQNGGTSPSSNDDKDTTLSDVELALAAIGGLSSLITVLTGIIAVVYYIRSKYANREGGNGTAEEQRAAQRAGAEAARQTREALQDTFDNIGGRLDQIPTAENFQAQMDALRTAMAETLEINARKSGVATAEKMREDLRDLAAIENTDAIQEAVTALTDAQAQFALGNLEGAIEKLAGVVDSEGAILESLGDNITAEQAEAYREANQRAQIEAILTEDMQEASENVAAGEEEIEDAPGPEI